MLKYQRRTHTEDTLRKHLARLAQKEQEYRDTRIREIANGDSSKRPLLESRNIYREMEDIIRKGIRTEAEYNKDPDYETIDGMLTIYKIETFQDTIWNDKTFATSREILKKRNAYIEKQRIAREQNRSVQAYYSPEGNLIPIEQQERMIYEEKKEKKAEVVAAEIENVLRRREALKKGDGIDYQAILDSVPKE